MTEFVARFYNKKHNHMIDREVVGWAEDGVPLIVAPGYAVRLRADDYAGQEGLTLERVDKDPGHVTATIPAAPGTWMVHRTDDEEPELYLTAVVAWETVAGEMRAVCYEIGEGQGWAISSPLAIVWPDGRAQVADYESDERVREFLDEQQVAYTHIG